MRSPFKFLDSYTAKDKDVFFGRDKEIETLYNLVYKTPLVLVYGLSGTGKTSLVQCGLSTRFDGPDWLPFHIRKEEDINLSLRKALNAALENKKTDNLKEAVNELFYTYFRPVYLIFDQFEELFILGTEAEQQQFMSDIRALLDAQLPCKVVFIMREEYIGAFYEFEKELPNIFDHKLRVEPMNNKRVREVMLQSFAQFNISLEAPADKLCQTMIDNISAGKSGIPLTYLQVYLDMLYREDFARTYPEGAPLEKLPPLILTKDEIDKFGEIDDVLDRYIKKQIKLIQTKTTKLTSYVYPQSVKSTLDAFVTDEGTKRPVYYQRKDDEFNLEKRIEKQINLPKSILNFHLIELEKARILRFGDDQIELAHDSLALLIDRQRTDTQRQLNDLRRRIHGDYRTWKDTGEYLSQKRLSTYEDFLPNLRLIGKLHAFVEDSRTDINNKELLKSAQKERELKLVNEKLRTEKEARKKQYFFSLSLCVSLLLSLGVGWWAFSQKELADARYLETKQEKNTVIANDFAFKAKQLLQEGRRTEAFNVAAFAHSFVQKENTEITSILRDAVYYSSENENDSELPWSMTFQGHEEDVNSAKISYNGKWIVTGSDDYTAKLWNVITGQEIRTFQGHKDVINSINFSSDDKWLVTGSDDSTAKLWDVTTGKEIYTFRGHEDVVNSVYFSSDNKRMITGSDDKTAKLWDVEKGQVIKSFKGHKDGILSAKLFFNDKKLATSSSDYTVKIWDIDSEKEIQNFKGHKSIVSSIKISSDEKRIATGSNDKTAILWDIKTGKKIQSFKGHEGSIISVNISSDDKKLLTGSWDKTIKIWDIETGREIQSFLGHEEDVLSVNLSLDGKTLITGSADNTAKLWKLEIANKVTTFKGHEKDVTATCLFDNGTKLLTSSWDNSIKLWDAETGKEIYSFTGHEDNVTSITMSPNEKQFITGCWDGTAKLWDLNTKKEIQSFVGHEGIVTSVIFSLDGRKLVTGNTDYSEKLWDVETGKEIQSFIGHKNYVTSVAITQDGKHLITGSADKSVKIWSIGTGEEVQTLIGHKNFITSISLSKNGKWLATGSTDNTAKLWNLETGKEVKSFTGHKHYIFSVKLFSGSKLLITGSYDNTAKIWDTKTGKEIRSFKGHKGDVSSVSISNNEEILVTGSEDKTAKKWILDKEWKITAEDLTQKMLLPKSISLIDFQKYNLQSILLKNKEKQEEWLYEQKDISILRSIAFNLIENNKISSSPLDYNKAFDLADQIYKKILILDKSPTYQEKRSDLYYEWSNIAFNNEDFKVALAKANLAYELYPSFKNLLQIVYSKDQENEIIPIEKALTLNTPYDLEQAALYFKEKQDLSAAKQLYEKSYSLNPLKRIKEEIEKL